MMLNILSISLSMSIVIIMLVLFRNRINHNYHAKVMCVLWLVIALRMMIPVHLEFQFYQPLVNLDISEEIIEISDVNQVDSGVLTQTNQKTSDFAAVTNLSVSDIQYQTMTAVSLEDVISFVWMTGACLVLCVNLVSYISVSRWLKKHCVKIKRIGNINIYSSKSLPEPFAFGVLKPSVFLSEEFQKDEWVLNHELTHCKHHDGLMQMIMCLVKAIHWFNPFVYMMEKQWNADREMYCDETVLKDKTKSERVDYMMTLYNAAESMTNKRFRFTSGLLDGESHVVERFRNIKKNQLKRRGIVLMSILCMMIVMASGLVGCTQETTEIQQDSLFQELVEHLESNGGSITALLFEEEAYIEKEDGTQELDYAKSFSSSIPIESKKLIDSIKQIKVSEIEFLQMDLSDKVLIEVETNIGDGYMGYLTIYENGTMRVTSNLELGRRKIEYYQVSSNIEFLKDYVYQNFVDRWTSEKGKKYIEYDPEIASTWPYSLVINGLEE